MPPETPETWRRRAKDAEAKAVALEAENTQLRSERTNAVLAAARAEKSAQDAQQPIAEEPTQKLDALTTGMKIAEEALREAERERDDAIRNVRDSLRQEYAQRVEAIRRCHAAELSAQFEKSEMQARQAVADELDALKKDLQEARAALSAAGGSADAVRTVEVSLRKEFSRRIDAIQRGHAAELSARCRDAESRARQEITDQIDTLGNELTVAREALRTAGHERESALQRAEESLRSEFARQYDALRERHAIELAAQLSDAKKRFAEELMANLAAAHAEWQADTEKKLQRARREARDALARVRAVWRRRSKAAVWKGAMVWRARERRRLTEARTKWDAVHRAALEACDRRWRARLDRLKRTARRSPWQGAPWQRAREGAAAVAAQFATLRAMTGRWFESRRSAIGQTGFVAVILFAVAAHFGSMASVPIRGPGERTATAAAQTVRQEQVARLPRGRAVDHAPAVRDRSQNRPQAPSAKMPARPDSGLRGSLPDETLTDAELRQRLEAKIRRLRTELSTK